jgi:hypothetical protein
MAQAEGRGFRNWINGRGWRYIIIVTPYVWL